jgi:hypothetical protein
VSGFYRFGEPGEDVTVHLNTGRRSTAAPCAMPRFPEDDPQFGTICGRMSIALCDAPKCDIPICERHRTKHRTRLNTDFCPQHKALAKAEQSVGTGATDR